MSYYLQFNVALADSYPDGKNGKSKLWELTKCVPVFIGCFVVIIQKNTHIFCDKFVNLSNLFFDEVSAVFTQKMRYFYNNTELLL